MIEIFALFAALSFAPNASATELVALSIAEPIFSRCETYEEDCERGGEDEDGDGRPDGGTDDGPDGDSGDGWS